MVTLKEILIIKPGDADGLLVLGAKFVGRDVGLVVISALVGCLMGKVGKDVLVVTIEMLGINEVGVGVNT